MTKEDLLSIPVSWIPSKESSCVTHTTLSDALFAIKTGIQKTPIMQMRALKSIDEAKYKQIKNQLPANIFSGTFTGGHAKSNLTDYYNLLTIDIDKLASERLKETATHLTEDPHVLAFWLSPSGNGFKGLVPLDYGEIDLKDPNYWHTTAYTQLSRYFKEKYNITLDKNCSDVSRLCYVSYDPGLVVKDTVTPFTVEPIEEVKKAKTESEKHHKAYSSYNGTHYRRNEPGRNHPRNRKTIGSIIRYLEKRKISITPDYCDWFSVAMAIVTTFNYDVGERYFLRLCRLDGAKHDEQASINLLRYCYEHSNMDIKLGTLIYFAQRRGYKFNYKAVP